MKNSFPEKRLAACVLVIAGVLVLLGLIPFGEAAQGWQLKWGNVDIEMPYPIMAAGMSFTVALRLWHEPRFPDTPAE